MQHNKKREGKITVKYFVNERLLPFLGKEILQEKLGIQLNQIDKQFPLYIKVIVKCQHTSFKSRLNLFLTLKQLEQPTLELREKLDKEIQLIERIVHMLNPFDRDNFSIKEVIKIYEPNTAEINKRISMVLLKHIKDKLVAIKQQMRLLKDLETIEQNQVIIKQINKEIFSTSPDIYTLYLLLNSLKHLNENIDLYTETSYAFNNIYSFLIYKTKKKYYMEDLLSGELYQQLREIINASKVEELENDLNEMLKFL